MNVTCLLQQPHDAPCVFRLHCVVAEVKHYQSARENLLFNSVVSLSLIEFISGPRTNCATLGLDANILVDMFDGPINFLIHCAIDHQMHEPLNIFFCDQLLCHLEKEKRFASDNFHHPPS